MNTPVKFELAKLLKEKGYDIPTKKYYEYALKSRKNKEDGYSGSFGWKKGELNLQSDYFQNNSKSDFSSEMWYMCSAPTIAEVVMWLYEKHGVWISLDWMTRIKPYNSGFISHLRGTNKRLNQDNFIVINDTLKPGYEVFNSPTEAYEAAIEYALNNLI